MKLTTTKSRFLSLATSWALKANRYVSPVSGGGIFGRRNCPWEYVSFTFVAPVRINSRTTSGETSNRLFCILAESLLSEKTVKRKKGELSISSMDGGSNR